MCYHSTHLPEIETCISKTIFRFPRIPGTESRDHQTQEAAQGTFSDLVSSCPLIEEIKVCLISSPLMAVSLPLKMTQRNFALNSQVIALRRESSLLGRVSGQ